MWSAHTYTHTHTHTLFLYFQLSKTIVLKSWPTYSITDTHWMWRFCRFWLNDWAIKGKRNWLSDWVSEYLWMSVLENQNLRFRSSSSRKSGVDRITSEKAIETTRRWLLNGRAKVGVMIVVMVVIIRFELMETELDVPSAICISSTRMRAFSKAGTS